MKNKKGLTQKRSWGVEHTIAISALAIFLLGVITISGQQTSNSILSSLRGWLNVASVTPVPAPTLTPPYFPTYINEVQTWWPPEGLAAGLGIPGYAPENKYNIITLTFWDTTKPIDTALVWHNPTAYFGTQSPFGSTNADIRQNILNKYHDAGKKLIVSAFGWGPTPTTQGLDPTITCTSLANWVKTTGLDGVDIDYEDFAAMESGKAEAWLISCTKAIRNVLPVGQYILTHSPVAPWFAGTNINPGGGYTYIHQQVGDLIDWYNVQFYNQDNTSYDTYEKLFTQSGGYYAGTSVKEILDRGIPASKLLILKPAVPGDAINTGYVDPGNLASWITTFRSSYPNYEWNTGLGTWQYKNDVSGNFIGTVANSFGNINNPIVDTTAPSVPQSVVATPVSSSQIQLSWNASTDASGVTGYLIYRNESPSPINSVAGTSYLDSSLSGNTTYSYTIAAYDAAGNVSGKSSSVSATTKTTKDTSAPAAIKDLSATQVTSSSVTLSFTAPGDNGTLGTAAQYDIRYNTKKVSNTSFKLSVQAIGEPQPQASGTKQTYLLTGLKANTTYYVGMKTIDAAGNVSTLSNVVQFRTQSI